MADSPRLRIGEFSRRVGVSPELLRAWETRYGLLRPERSGGGLRLFSEQDERQVQLMVQNLAAGMPASEAARLALLGRRPGARERAQASEEIERALTEGVDALDEPMTQAALDRLLETFALPQALSEVILPFLRRLGERWAAAEIGIAHEHFASNVIGGRLRALARDWGSGVGPRAVLACQPGERHDLGLLCFGLVLREHGWRITYLGADTPLRDVVAVCGELGPAIVVLSAVNRERFRKSAEEILALSKGVRVALGGAGATGDLAGRLGVELLGGDAVGEASALVP
ncbi:MAG TPA: cobalamin-dependent protein [Solirubrobacteraceae bacterium]|nr:cobalamin-dependent protein [Solirubrobacteraceae bacterium]